MAFHREHYNFHCTESLLSSRLPQLTSLKHITKGRRFVPYAISTNHVVCLVYISVTNVSLSNYFFLFMP